MLRGDVAEGSKKQGIFSKHFSCGLLSCAILTFVGFDSVAGEQGQQGIIVPSFDKPFSGGFRLPELEKIPPKVEDLRVYSRAGRIPSLWSVELVGADLVRDSESSFDEVEKAAVVVFDDLAKADGYEEIPVPERKPRKVSLPLGALFDLFSEKNEEPKGSNDTLPDFDRRLRDFVKPRETLDPREAFSDAPTSHGMHVLGTIGAEAEVFGTSRLVKLYGADIFRTPIYTRQEDWTDAFEALLDTHLRNFALNLSLTMGSSSRLEDIVERLEDERNAQLIIAAGNFGEPIQNTGIAGRLHRAIVVSALSPSGILANFSSYGPEVDLTAPGSNVLSRGESIAVQGGRVEIKSGTSMATPNVTGAFANLRAVHPTAPSQGLREILYETAWDLGRYGRDDHFGWGLLNSFKAVRVAKRLKSRQQKGLSFEEALDSSQLYNLSRDRFTARLSSMRAKFGSSERERSLRAYFMLASHPESLERLARLYDSSFPAYAKALRFMAINREHRRFDTNELHIAADLVVNLHNRHQGMNSGDFSVMRSLSNVGLILAVNKHPRLDLVSRMILSTTLADLSPRDFANSFEEFFSADENFSDLHQAAAQLEE